MTETWTDERIFYCTQCGNIVPNTTVLKRRDRRSNETRCADCIGKPSKFIRYGSNICRPWTGEFDWDTMTPMKDGRPYMEGHRKCGHADCVNSAHVLTWDKLEAERFGHRNMNALIKAVSAERTKKGIK